MSDLSITFVDGARISVDQGASSYGVSFLNTDTGELVYKTQLRPGHWASPNSKYYVNWTIIVESPKDLSESMYRFDCTGKKVWIELDSKALGDTLAWLPFAEEFRKKHGCEVHVGTFWNYLFKDQYPELVFKAPGELNDNGYYAGYKIGAFDDNYSRNRRHWRLVPLQQVAADVLGLEYREIRPRIARTQMPRPIQEKYVAISEFSTIKSKFWNYEGGWQAIVDHLNQSGFKVISVSREVTKLRNVIPMNSRPIEETIRNIQHSEFFIGVGSGLSWLAWAMNVQTVLISGFSLPFSEMTDCVRVHNPNVCTGCYNDITIPYERGKWEWCPRGKNYECTTSITPAMVIEAMQPLLKGEKPAPRISLPAPPGQMAKFGDIAIHVRDGIGRQGDLDIGAEHFTRDIYQLRRLAKFIHPKTLVDVGGHIGCMARLARSIWPDIRITAIEPNDESAALYRLNNPSAELHECAVGEAGTCILADNPRWSGGGLVIRPGEKYPDNYAVSREIECRPLHELVKGPIDLLKLDCEGGEIHVLETMPDDLVASIGYIVGEYHCDWPVWRDLVLKRFPEWDVMRLMEKNFLAGPKELVSEMRNLFVAASIKTTLGNEIRLTLDGNPTIHIDGVNEAEYSVSFNDLENGRNLYTTKIGCERWASVKLGTCRRWGVTVLENSILAFHKEMGGGQPAVSSNGKVKVLFVAPHCSTGGMPQYLLKCVSDLKAAGVETAVVEYTCIATNYVVQRKQLQALAPFHSLNGEKVQSLRRIIDEFKPDVIHLQEFPETWLYDHSSKAAMDMIYQAGRKYRIVETSHSSAFTPDKKIYRPDSFVFVSRFQADLFKDFGVPIQVVEYELPKRTRPDRTKALAKLGLDPAKRHILNVGLFTPDKNQTEVLELARRLPEVEFHCVGNLADNFRFYWQALIDKKCPNCTVWGERDDVDSFYSSMDLLLHPSKRELNPIVIKEALSWSTPVFMRNLPTYCGSYDDERLVTFIDADISRTERLLTQHFNLGGMGVLLKRIYDEQLHTA